MATRRSRDAANSLNSIEGLEEIIKNSGAELPKQNKVVSALRTAGGILGATNSLVAGATNALVNGRNPITEGASSFWNSLTKGDTRSFSDVIRTQYTPKTFGDKAAVETLGFAADVVFDPLTYLTFGLGAGTKIATKAGEKALSKGGMKAYQNATRTLIEKGLTDDVAESSIRELLSKTYDDGVDVATRQAFNSKGVTDDVIDQIVTRGNLFDEGGVKFAGWSAIKGSTIANSKLGKGAKAFTEMPEVAKRIDAAKTLFSFGGKVDPRITKILEEGAAKTSQGIGKIFNRLIDTFEGVSEKQLEEFYTAVEGAKRAAVERINNKVALNSTLDDSSLKAITGLNVVKRKGELTKEAKNVLESKARKEVKEELRGEKMRFEDLRLQKLADDLFEGKTSFTDELAELVGLPADQRYKFYIPTKYEEFEKAGIKVSSGLSAPKVGGLKVYRGTDRVDQIKNPFELYSKQAIENTAARIKTETIQKVADTVGLKADEILKMAGVTEKLSKEAIDNLAEKMGYAKITRKGLDNTIEFYVPKLMKENLDDLMNPKASAIDTIAKLSGFDWATGLMKSYVTALFPAFHMRNMVSNQFQNAIKLGVNVLNPALQKRGLDMAMYTILSSPSAQRKWKGAAQVAEQIGNKIITTKTGRKIPYKKLIQQIQDKSTFLDSGAFGDFEQMLDSGMKHITGKKDFSKINPLSPEFAPMKAGRFVGNLNENQSKLVHIVSQIEEGKTLDEAIKSAEDVLFNYSKLTPFEKEYMRRIIPFYTFMSRNLALQAKTLATTPGFVANQMKGFNSASGVAGGFTDDEEEGIPDYLLKQLGIKMGTNKEGQPQLLAGFGLPIEEFLNRFSGEKGFAWNAITNTIVASNPIIKFPIEKASGVDLFYGKPIAEINKADGIKSMFDSMPKPVSDQLKNAIGYYEKEVPVYDSSGKKVGRTVKAYADPVKLHLLRNLPTARLQSTADFLNSPEQTIEAKALRFFTGAKLYSIDTEREKFFKELDRKKELQKYLVDVLGYKTFESLYKPKSINNLPLEGEEDKTNNE